MSNTRANLYEVIKSFSANTKSIGGAIVQDVFVGSEFEYDRQNDIKFPAILIEFPISFIVSEPTKTYNMAFQVIDRMEVSQNASLISQQTQADMLKISSKIESIGHAIYKRNSDNFDLSGWTMTNTYDGIIDVEQYKDYTARARFEFDVVIPLNQCLLE